MRIAESLARTARRLSDGGIPDANIEAEVVLRQVLGLNRSELFASLREPIQPAELETVGGLVRRRMEGEPLPYISGHREFYGLEFVVSPDVFIPRQESELLVDKALELAASRGHGEGLKIADVGTGSGAIAIAIACNLAAVTVYATDLSREALGVADINRRKHGVEERVHLRHGDLLEALSSPVDIIVSNPPYIGSSEIADLAVEVRREPLSALDGGADGLGVTGRLLQQAPAYLRPGGCALVEISPGQLSAVSRRAREALPEADVSFARDLLGHPRVVAVELPEGARCVPL